LNLRRIMEKAGHTPGCTKASKSINGFDMKQTKITFGKR
jgi:hypothetical protein